VTKKVVEKAKNILEKTCNRSWIWSVCEAGYIQRCETLTQSFRRNCSNSRWNKWNFLLQICRDLWWWRKR